MNCINTKSKEFQELLEASKLPSLLLEMRIAKWQEQNGLDNFPKVEDIIQSNEVNFQKNQTVSNEGLVASEKTIRDLVARMSDRIGIPVRFESDRSKEYKGKIENGTAYVNLAYATLDTPIHEILGHPIIRAIKNTTLSERSSQSALLEYKNAFIVEENGEFFIKKEDGSYWSNFETKEEAEKELKILQKANSNETSQLYQNLLKELETGKGKEVLDRIKRDYNVKSKAQYIKSEKIRARSSDLVYLENYIREKNLNPLYDEIEPIQYNGKVWNISFEPDGENGMDIYFYYETEEQNLPETYYTLEEQQEEAIVELLGLMTAEKLDKVKDGKLISLLKRLLKEMKAFMRSLISQKEVEIDKLPDNMTLGDLSDLLAYSNSKLILPGNEVIYTTPDNNKFKTYQEASNHISNLAKSVEDVDLDNVKLKKEESKRINNLKQDINELEKQLEEKNNVILPKDLDFLDTNNEFLEIIYKKEDNKWFKYVEGDKGKEISSEEILELYKNMKYGQDSYDNISLETRINELKKQLNNLLIEENNTNVNSFIEKNKEYEQSKEIIEEWKKINNIQYNPEEIYSRGQEFSSVVGAYSSFDVNLMMQNLLSHIEDNEKAGGKFAISAYTKPIDKQIGHLEGGGGKIKFKLYPKSNDILWAANADVYSGSVWDASEKVNKDKKSELLGVSYTKYPSLRNVDMVQPNLASIVEDLTHHHNELGITLTGNNFRLEYDEDIPYTTKKIIDGINKILDQKYGKLVKPEINVKNREGFKVYFTDAYGNSAFSNPNFNTIEEAQAFIDEKKDTDISFKIVPNKGIQPTQTNETLKESIDSVKDRASLVESKYDQYNDEYQSYTINGVRYVADLYEKRYQKFEPGYSGQLITKEEFEANKPKQKEYTSQALINTKIAALKEVAKKYPRSLIRSEVKPIEKNYNSNYDYNDLFEDLPFQKIPSVDFTNIIDDNQESIFETQYKKTENAGDNSFIKNKNLLFGEKEVTDTLHVNEILDNMIKSQDLEISPEFVFILGKAMNVNKLSNAKFKLVTKESFDELASKSAGKGTPVMFYDEATNTISTTVEVLEQISMTDLALSILHEVAHSTTSHYYNNPDISFQAKEMKDLIDAGFQQYKYLAYKKNPNGEYSYGFTNEKEFIAELYSNPQFREEIIELDKGFWRKLVDAIRRTFNLPKTKYNDQLIESALLISTVEQFVENNESSQLVGSARNNYSSSFNSVDFKKLDDIKNKTIDDKLENLYKVAQDNIDQLLRRSEASAKKHGTKNEKFVDKINLLKEHLTNAELLNKWEGVNNYVDFMIGQIMFIDRKINNGTLNERLDIIDKLYEYAAASDLIKPLGELFADARIKTLPQETQNLIKEIDNKLAQFSGIHDRNIRVLFAKRKSIAKELLQNPYYSQEVITQFERELGKEYPKDSKISKKEWVSQQLLGPRAEELKTRIDEHINELFEGIGSDISKWDKTIYSTLNTGSRLIHLVQKIISSMKLKIDNEVNDFDFQLTAVYDKFVKKHGITKPSEMFKNILEYDSEGYAYVKGFFNLKFKDKYRTEYITLLNQRNELIEKYNDQGLTLKEMYNISEYNEVSSKINSWRKENMTKVRVKNEDGTTSLKWQPKVSLYKNDFSKLSEEEKELLTLYRNIAKESDKVHRGKKSLLRNAGTALYFKLPSASISNMERVVEGKVNLKDTITQKISELTSWRPEEIEQYERQFNALGEEINSIPVLFRNKIKPEEQSLDIFTLIRLEKYNQINYKNKEENQLILETLTDVSKNKQYLKTEAGTLKIIKNLFGIRSKHVTFEGIQSQTYDRIKNVVEQSLYNKFNSEGFKILGSDVNKIVKTVHSHVGFLGMTLNYFNAPVNILNGEFQIMLEKVSGTISKGKMMKAHSKYVADLPNIIADISRPNKLSLVNQLNLKFDVFGGLSHNQQEFIKNSFAKAVTNKETLQVLQNGGEHLIQSVLNMALLDSIKVRNKEGLYIDKNGKVVNEENAASILDMISLNEDTKKLEFSEHLEYTDKSTVVKWNNGGLENVRLFIKKKIEDTMGQYDKNFQVDLQRHWAGQLVLMYKKFFMPLGVTRYRGGITSIFKDKENLDPSQMHWNEALQEYEEGFYITFGRYLMSVINNALITMIPNLKWQMTSQKWSEMSDYEKGNIRKATLEFGVLVLLNVVIIPILLGAADDDDDLEYLAFLGMRLSQELGQFTNIGDAYKIVRNPIASLNLIEDTINVGKFALSPGAWFSTTKEGDSKFLKAVSKVTIPSAWRTDKTSENMIKYMKRDLIVPFEEGYLYKSIFGTE